MHGVEDLGLLKMDFLGLRNLDVMEVALDLIEDSTGSRPDIDDVPLDDATTFDMLRRGDTIGVFQLEGGADAGPDAVAGAVRASRTSPRSSRSTGRVRWPRTCTSTTPTARTAASRSTYPHQDLEEILAPTYGLMIYQEQLMRVAQRLAGYSLEEADNLRKATGKKIRELIAKERTEVRRRVRRAGPRR